MIQFFYSWQEKEKYLCYFGLDAASNRTDRVPDIPAPYTYRIESTNPSSIRDAAESFSSRGPHLDGLPAGMDVVMRAREGKLTMADVANILQDSKSIYLITTHNNKIRNLHKGNKNSNSFQGMIRSQHLGGSRHYEMYKQGTWYPIPGTVDPNYLENLQRESVQNRLIKEERRRQESEGYRRDVLAFRSVTEGPSSLLRAADLKTARYIDTNFPDMATRRYEQGGYYDRTGTESKFYQNNPQYNYMRPVGYQPPYTTHILDAYEPKNTDVYLYGALLPSVKKEARGNDSVEMAALREYHYLNSRVPKMTQSAIRESSALNEARNQGITTLPSYEEIVDYYSPTVESEAEKSRALSAIADSTKNEDNSTSRVSEFLQPVSSVRPPDLLPIPRISVARPLELVSVIPPSLSTPAESASVIPPSLSTPAESASVIPPSLSTPAESASVIPPSLSTPAEPLLVPSSSPVSRPKVSAEKLAAVKSPDEFKELVAAFPVALQPMIQKLVEIFSKFFPKKDSTEPSTLKPESAKDKVPEVLADTKDPEKTAAEELTQSRENMQKEFPQLAIEAMDDNTFTKMIQKFEAIGAIQNGEIIDKKSITVAVEISKLLDVETITNERIQTCNTKLMSLATTERSQALHSIEILEQFFVKNGRKNAVTGNLENTNVYKFVYPNAVLLFNLDSGTEEPITLEQDVV